MQAKAVMPNPPPKVRKASRRVSGYPISIHVQKGTRAQQNLSILRPRPGLKKLECEPQLFVRRIATEDKPIRLSNARRRITCAGDPCGEGSGGTHHQVAIEEEKTLQRNVGVGSMVAANRGIGEIEELQHAIDSAGPGAARERRTANASIDRAADAHRIRQILGWSAEPRVEHTGSPKQRIAQGFGFQTPQVGAPEEPVLRIDGVARRIRFGAELIRSREHDLAM